MAKGSLTGCFYSFCYFRVVCRCMAYIIRYIRINESPTRQEPYTQHAGYDNR